MAVSEVTKGVAADAARRGLAAVREWQADDGAGPLPQHLHGKAVGDLAYAAGVLLQLLEEDGRRAMTRCQAAVPARLGTLPGWLICDQPATANYTYRCAHGHLVNRSNCPGHEPGPGLVGCKKCWDELGHNCDMEVQA